MFRLAVTIASVVALVPATALAADEKFIPGVTDVPSRAAEVQEPYIAGVTDVPSRAAEIDLTPTASGTSSGRSFDWLDAAVGATFTIALAAVLAAALLAVRRRTRVSALPS